MGSFSVLYQKESQQAKTKRTASATLRSSVTTSVSSPTISKLFFFPPIKIKLLCNSTEYSFAIISRTKTIGDWEHATLRFQVCYNFAFFFLFLFFFSLQLLFKRATSLTANSLFGSPLFLFFSYLCVQCTKQNGKPHTIYLSAHNFGAYYVWNEAAGLFHLHKGESPKQKVYTHTK